MLTIEPAWHLRGFYCILQGMIPMQIRMTGYDAPVLEGATKRLLFALAAEGIQTFGPLPLPVRYEGQRRIHRRLIELPDPSRLTGSMLNRVNLPPSVEVSIKSVDPEEKSS